MDAVGISKWIGEEEATGEEDDALLVLFHDLGAERDDICYQSIVIFLRKTVQSKAGVNDQLQNLLFLLCVSHLFFIDCEALYCSFLN